MKNVQKKICLLGDFAVGKTSLIRRYVEERFDEAYLSTIGVHMSRKRVALAELQVELFIWDLAGGEDFSGVGANYLRGSAGAILVADLTRPNSLEVLDYYAKQMLQINPSSALIFAANKVDLENERVITDHAMLSAIEPYATHYLLTSAKTGENVEAAFLALAELIK